MAKAPPEPPVRRYSGLTIAEWLTAGVGLGSALIGAGSLAVAWLTFETGKDTRDLKRAIGSLTDLAAQTKRQADNTSGQLAVLRDQVGEAKKQTAAISQQTTAIKASADANIQSAGAQKRAADIGASAARAAVTLSDTGMTGFDPTNIKDGKIQVVMRPQFSNVGGTSISLGLSTVVFSIGQSLPAVPNFAGAVPFGGGNELVVLPRSTFGPAVNIPYGLKKELVDDIVAHKSRVFVFGVINYTDAAQAPGRFCYAYEVQIENGAGKYFHQTGGPAYHCAQ
jgi:hypothetical protein